MLDAYIIDQMRRDHERRQREQPAQIPLHIEMPVPFDPPKPAKRSEDRGVVDVDFTIIL